MSATGEIEIDGAQADPEALPSLKRPLLFAAAVFLFDGLAFGQGGFALLLAGWAFLVRVPLAAMAWRDKPLRNYRLKLVAIYLLAVVGVFEVIALNRYFAGKRADEVVKAVEAYNARNKAYPQSLAQLVPDFLPAVPPAKYTLMLSDFEYRQMPKGEHALTWTVIPPNGRKTYVFEDKRWTASD